MINLEEFLIAQQVSWFKRANSSTRDNWRVDLKKIGNGSVLTVGKAGCSYDTFPIFKFLRDSFHRCVYSFNNLNDNFSKSLLLNNPLLTISCEDRRPLGINFFANSIPDIELRSVCSISIDQIANNNRLLSLDEITANTRVNFNLIVTCAYNPPFTACKIVHLIIDQQTGLLSPQAIFLSGSGRARGKSELF